jgi:hypothetical protein
MGRFMTNQHLECVAGRLNGHVAENRSDKARLRAPIGMALVIQLGINPRKPRAVGICSEPIADQSAVFITPAPVILTEYCL